MFHCLVCGNYFASAVHQCLNGLWRDRDRVGPTADAVGFARLDDELDATPEAAEFRARDEQKPDYIDGLGYIPEGQRVDYQKSPRPCLGCGNVVTPRGAFCNDCLSIVEEGYGHF